MPLSEKKMDACICILKRSNALILPKICGKKIYLSRNYTKALAQIDEHLQYFPKVIIHRNKQRLTKIHQYLIRMRKIELKVRAGKKAKLVRVHRKVEQREERRERKALVAAKIETVLEKELTERLAKGAYGDIYNFPESPYQKALESVEGKDEEEQEEETEGLSEEEEEMESMVEYVEDLDSELEDDEAEDMEDMADYMGDGKWGSTGGSSDDNDDDHDDDEEEDDDNDTATTGDDSKKPAAKPAPKPKRRRGPRVEIEYEEEREDQNQSMVSA
uniref:Protein MAK16 homolog n=1 Tax=Entomoneis paludosa TaxID=265537 RepID=A0A7S2YQZ8_9STRA|mmetsp:Transcript_6331/g.13192  ORF Transcript_6331/g.13192 Transcript_6331/m.13192 type:complete len:274 (+) Transcript_6331:266-1087(+)